MTNTICFKNVFLAVLLSTILNFMTVHAQEGMLPFSEEITVTLGQEPQLSDDEKIEQYAPLIAKQLNLSKEKLLGLAEDAMVIESIKKDMCIRVNYPRTWGRYYELMAWYFIHGTEYQDMSGISYNIFEPRRGTATDQYVHSTIGKSTGAIDTQIKVKIPGCAFYRKSEKDPWYPDYTSLDSQTQKGIYDQL